MSFDADQFRSLVSRVLQEMGPKYASDSAVELLMLTAAQESHLGKYLKQINGPARGVFQIEPKTEYSFWHHYLDRKPELADEVAKFTSEHLDDDFDVEGNLPYQIAFARAYYWQFSAPLPRPSDIEGLALYYKMYWNSKEGKATVEEAAENYERFCR